MFRWTVEHPQTTPTPHIDISADWRGHAPTSAAAWHAATDAATDLIAYHPSDTHPVLLRVDPAHLDTIAPEQTAACSVIVVSPERDAADLADLPRTRAAIEDHVAAILGAAALTGWASS